MCHGCENSSVGGTVFCLGRSLAKAAIEWMALPRLGPTTAYVGTSLPGLAFERFLLRSDEPRVLGTSCHILVLVPCLMMLDVDTCVLARLSFIVCFACVRLVIILFSSVRDRSSRKPPPFCENVFVSRNVYARWLGVTVSIYQYCIYLTNSFDCRSNIPRFPFAPRWSAMKGCRP